MITSDERVHNSFMRWTPLSTRKMRMIHALKLSRSYLDTGVNNTYLRGFVSYNLFPQVSCRTCIYSNRMGISMQVFDWYKYTCTFATNTKYYPRIESSAYWVTPLWFRFTSHGRSMVQLSYYVGLCQYSKYIKSIVTTSRFSSIKLIYFIIMQHLHNSTQIYKIKLCRVHSSNNTYQTKQDSIIYYQNQMYILIW